MKGNFFVELEDGIRAMELHWRSREDIPIALLGPTGK